MGCSPAPVAQRAYADAKRLYPRVSFLGIVGDQAHQTSRSGHNCGAMRELSCTNPNYAHAVDIGVPNSTVGLDLVRRFRRDARTHYVIYRAVGYRSWHRGGSTWSSSGHWTHVHVSFGCGSTFQTHPFWGAASPPATQFPDFTSLLGEPMFVYGTSNTGRARNLLLLPGGGFLDKQSDSAGHLWKGASYGTVKNRVGKGTTNQIANKA